MTRCLRVPAADVLRDRFFLHGLCFYGAHNCRPTSPTMRRRKEKCGSKNCTKEYNSTRKGRGGRQYVQPEYVTHCKHMLKSDAKVGDWICVTCRDQLRLHSASQGTHAQPVVRVRVASFSHLKLKIVYGGAHYRSTWDAVANGSVLRTKSNRIMIP